MRHKLQPVRKFHRRAFSSRHALEEGGLSGQAWKAAKELCYGFALGHGLPEIKGYYGITKDGEFVTM